MGEPAVDFCPICAAYDYLTPDTPHHHDLFHADTSLSHVNYSLLVDRVRALEKRQALRDGQASTMVDAFDLKIDGLERQLATLRELTGTLIARIATLEAALPTKT